MVFNIANYANLIPNILNNPFIKHNLTMIIIIIIVILIALKILSKPKYIKALKRAS